MQFDLSESAVKQTRIRTSNFTEREKNLLFSLVFKYRNIIENKKTDGITIQEKKQTWEKIRKEFNSGSPGLIPRSTESLRKCYDNRKKELRKDMAKERCELYKTGGGPPPPPNPKKDEDLLLSIVNKKTIFGLENLYDGDRSVVKTQISDAQVITTNKSKQQQITPTNQIKSDQITKRRLEITPTINPQENKKQRNYFLNFKGDENPEEDENEFVRNINPSIIPNNTNNNDTNNILEFELNNEGVLISSTNSIVNECYADDTPDKQDSEIENFVIQYPDNERQCLDNKRQNHGNVRHNNKIRQNLNPRGRRRPATVVKALTSSNIAEKYDKLLDQRLLLSNHEIAKIKSTVEQNDVEHKLRVQSLQLDIAIKKKQLHALEEIE